MITNSDFPNLNGYTLVAIKIMINWGVPLKMGDPQVTMGFNTKMV